MSIGNVIEGHDRQPAPTVRALEPTDEAADAVALIWGRPISRSIIEFGLPIDRSLAADTSLTISDVVERDLSVVAEIWPTHSKVLFKILDVVGRRFDRSDLARMLRDRLSAMIGGPLLSALDQESDDAAVRSALVTVGTPVVERHVTAGLISALRLLTDAEREKLERAPERDQLTRRQTTLAADVDECRREGRRRLERLFAEELESVEAQKAAIPKYDHDRHRRASWLAAHADHPMRGAHIRSIATYQPAAENPGPLVPSLAVLSTAETIEISGYPNANAVYKAASDLRAQLDDLVELEPTVAPTAPGEVWTSV